jgi:Flp pilus assembly protein TadG
MRKLEQSGSRERGHAAVEMAFLMPWIFFLFAGAFDLGFYSHALIAVTNAARAGAMYAASGGAPAAHGSGACAYALAELRGLPNARHLSSCNALPLVVTTSAVTGADGAPAAEVRVVYQTPRLIPIPGLPASLAISRTAQMRVQEL